MEVAIQCLEGKTKQMMYETRTDLMGGRQKQQLRNCFENFVQFCVEECAPCGS